jgi:phage tail P2-like protein
MSEELDLLPPNATAQERAMSLATARAGEVPMQIKQVWNPQTCPAGILPWLAWALSVDAWDSNWTEQQKRDAIEASVSVHRVKGTVGAVRRALQAIGYEVMVDENTGTPYTFRLQVDIGETGGTEEIYDEAERIALRNKNARSHLLGVDAIGTVSGLTRLCSVGIDGNTTRVWPDVVELLSRVDILRILSAEQTIDTARVIPEALTDITVSGELTAGGAFAYDLTISI